MNPTSCLDTGVVHRSKALSVRDNLLSPITLITPITPIIKVFGAVLVGRELKSSGISRINILFEIDYDKVVVNTPGADT